MAMELDANALPTAGATHADDQQTVQVAEATTTTPPANGTAPTTTIQLEAGDIVHLPAGADISHPVQVGADLEFVQPDGSIILIPNGAVADLTVFIGNVEIPADTIAALFTDNNIQPAEGGNNNNQHAHGNFEHAPGGIGTSFGLTDLLAPTDLAFGTNNLPQLQGNIAPFFDGPLLALVSEEALPDGHEDLSDPDDALDSKVFSHSLGVHDSDALTFSITPPSNLTSGGESLDWSTVVTANSFTLIGTIGTAPNTEQIISIVINFTARDYTVTLSGPIDHPDWGEHHEDIFNALFNITATDTHGATGHTSLTIEIEDDSPALKSGDGQSRVVDEDDIDTHLSQGNHADDGPWKDGSFTGNPFIENGDNPHYLEGPADVFGNLGSVVDFGADGPRTDARGGAFVLLNTADTQTYLSGLGLSSKGDDLQYSIDPATGTITATATHGNDTRTVFVFHLDSDGHYSFKLYDQLDHDSPYDDFPHDGPGHPGDHFPLADQNLDLQDALPHADVTSIDFGQLVRAFDNDNDYIDLDGHLKIAIRDDIPVLTHEHEVKTANEDDISTLNDGIIGGSLGTSPNDGNQDGSYTGSPFGNGPGPADVFGNLQHLVSVGADEIGHGGAAFSFINEGLARLYLQSLGLSSKGHSLSYDIQNGVLYAFDNAGPLPGTHYDPAVDRLVFELDLSSNGNYAFKLYDQLDHDKPYDDNGDHPSIPGDTATADQNLDLQDGSPFHDVTAIDFGKIIDAADYDGDRVNLGDSFKIQVRDDIPVATGQTFTGTADEDDLHDYNLLYPLVDFWQGSIGTSPNDGTLPDDSITGLLGTVPVWGNLSNLVQVGADEGGKFQIVSEHDAETWLQTAGAAGGPLKSDGHLINDAHDITIPGIGEAMGFFASDGRLVFGIYMGEDGTFNFRLFDQLDHPIGDDPNTPQPEAVQDTLTLDFSKLITFSDFDHDKLIFNNGTITINVVDDVPVLVDSISATLDEDDLNDFNPINAALLALSPDTFKDLPSILSVVGSTGTDGNPHGLLDNILGTTSQSGFLDEIIGHNVVNGGADEFGKFGLVSDSYASTLIANLGLKSDGSLIDHAESVNIPILGTVMGFFAADGHLVFTLTVGPLGDYDIRLVDQLDHPIGDDPTTPQPEAVQDSLTLDLGKFITFTDADGDKIDLSNHVTLTVVDDVPVVTGSLNVTLDEDDLSDFDPLTAALLQLTPATFEALPSILRVVGSDGTDQNPTGLLDNVLGTTSQSGFLNELIGNQVVTGGADEFGKFGLISDAYANTLVASLNLKSDGSPIDHVESIDLGTIGNVNLGTVMGFFSDDGRLIFTLTVGDLGNYDIRLVDQLDHPLTDNPDTAAIETAFQDVLHIDLGKFVTYTDFDGDKIDLGTGHLTLDVVDDVPETVAGAQVIATVEEEDGTINIPLLSDMGHGNEDTDDDAGGLDTDTAGNSSAITNLATGSLGSLVKVGADDHGVFAFDPTVKNQIVQVDGHTMTSHGATVRYEYLTLQLIPNTPPVQMLVGYADVNNDGDYDPISLTPDRLVFAVALSEVNPLDGLTNDQFVYIQLDQIDHAPPPAGTAAENLGVIDLSKTITFTDADGDKIGLNSGSFEIQVIDDKPSQTGLTLHATVEEEQKGTGQLDHGNEDTIGGGGQDIDKDTGTTGGAANGTSNTVKGDLRSLVSVGADEVTPLANLGTFTLAAGNLPALHSKGDPVVYEITHTTNHDLLTAFVDVNNDGHFNGADRKVFTLDVENNPTFLNLAGNAGDYTFTLFDQLDHPAGNGENVLTLDLSSFIHYSDHDGDTISLTQGTFTIGVIDDTPILNPGAAPVVGHVDEDDLSTSSSNPGPDRTTGNVDADSDKDEYTFTQTMLRTLVKSGADEDATFNLAPSQAVADGGHIPSGNVLYTDGTTVLQSHGHNVVWGVDGADVVGYVDTDSSGGYNSGDAVVFRLTQDPTTNAITFDLQDAIDHPVHDTNGGDNEKITIDVTTAFVVHDFDMDYVALNSNSIKIEIEDDVPANGHVTLNSNVLVHDETPGVDSNAQDVASSTTLSALFSTVNRGSDPDVAHVDGGAIGYAQANLVASTSVDYGADGKGADVSFSLTLSAQGVDSGLKTTEGQKIYLWNDGTHIVGLVDGDATPGVLGTETAAFALYVDPATGQITIAQYLSIQHDDPLDPDEPNAGSHTLEAIKASVLSITATFTDGDGDKLTAGADIGPKISFQDDGPKLTALNQAGVLDGLDFGNNFVINNSWQPGSGIATGTAGNWTIATSGDGVPNDGGGTVQLERVGDGYLGMHSSTHGYMVDLDASPHDVKISQTLNNLTTGQSYDLHFEAGAPYPSLSHLEVYFGGVKVFDLNPPPAQMSEFTIHLLAGSGDGHNLLEFREAGSPDNQGTYLANVSVGDIIIDETHGIDADSDDVAPNTLFNLIANKGDDADMQHQPEFARGTSPIVSVTADFGADGPKGGSPASGTSYALFTTDATDSQLMTTAGQHIYLYNESYPDGLNTVSYVVGRIGGQNGDAAFAFRIDGSGIVNVVQYVSLEHPNHATSDEGIYLNTGSLGVSVTVTDGDGDSDTKTADISARIRFEDDGPTVHLGTLSGDNLLNLTAELDETSGGPDRYNTAIGETETGTNTNTDDSPGVLARVVTNVAGGLVSLFPPTIVYGADGQGAPVSGHLSFTGIPAGGIATNLSATHGGPITLTMDGADIVGIDSLSQEAFRISIVDQGGGNYQLVTTLSEALDHSSIAGNLYDATINLLLDSGSVSLKYDITVTDGDGDTASDSATLPIIGTQSSYFSFDDDGPQLTAPAHIGTNLIQNGSFESDVGLGASGWDTFYSIPGWSVPDQGAPGLNDDAPFEVQTGAPGGDFGAEDGNTKVELDSDLVGTGSDDNPSNKTNATMQQSVLTTEGETYEISFWYAPRPNDGDPDSSSFKVYWNGAEVLNVDSTTASPSWTQYTITVVGTGDPNTALAFQATGQENSLGAYIDNVSMFQVPSVHVDEDGLRAGNHDSAPGDDVVPNTDSDSNEATNVGSLGIDWGQDNYDDAPDQVVNVAQSSTAFAYTTVKQDTPSGVGDRSVTFTNDTVVVTGVASLTSHGQAVAFHLVDNDTRIVGYTDFGGQNQHAAIEVSLSDDGAGSFRVALLDQIDHPLHATEDNIGLTFGYTATDADGDQIKGSFAVSVDDDLPTIGEPATNHYVEEEEVVVVGPGNEDGSGTGDNDHVDGIFPFIHNDTTQFTQGSLAISWGADNGDARTVHFADGTQAPQGLTSRGDAVHYTVIHQANGGDVLLAYTEGHAAPVSVPTSLPDAISAGIVFIVTLSDTGNGSYGFTLVDTLDQHQQGEDSLPLSFNFVATDSDGDSAPASFSVNVIDDTPISLGGIVTGVVEEEQLPGVGNEDTRAAGNPDPDTDTNGNPNHVTTSATGSLFIGWGGDDSNDNVDGGFTTAGQVDGDRSVVFATGSGSDAAIDASSFLQVKSGNTVVALGDLTSGGEHLVYTLSADGRTLTATTAITHAPVFTVTLHDTGAGSYDFELQGKLDHPVHGTSPSQEDTLNFNFTFTARDDDGDTTSDHFAVKVIDDSPVVGTPDTGDVSETNVVEPLVNGSFEDDSLATGNPGVITDSRGNYSFDLHTGWTVSGFGGTFDPATSIGIL